VTGSWKARVVVVVALLVVVDVSLAGGVCRITGCRAGDARSMHVAPAC